jgi:TonB family protein
MTQGARDMLQKWMIASVGVLGAGWFAGAPIETITQTSSLGRSCDGAVAASADTIIDSKDPLLRNLRPTSGKGAARYPVDMRHAGITGEVIASFVIDTLGVVPTGGVWIQSETRTSFGDAVCAYLRDARFAPLVLNGKRWSVRVVNSPTTFDIVR